MAGGVKKISQPHRQISGRFVYATADGGPKTAMHPAQAGFLLYPYQTCIMSMPS